MAHLKVGDIPTPSQLPISSHFHLSIGRGKARVKIIPEGLKPKEASNHLAGLMRLA